jgi:hypothetical protein
MTTLRRVLLASSIWQARRDAAVREWWARHPRAERAAARIIVVTIAILFGTHRGGHRTGRVSKVSISGRT